MKILFFAFLNLCLLIQLGFGGSNVAKTGQVRPINNSASGLSVVAYYTVWSYCDMPPQDVDYSAITHLVLFGGASSGITPNVNTAPYFPPATPGNNSFSITFTGTPGWCANPIAGKNHVQVMRDSCNAHGVKLLLDLGGEYGTPASAFAALIADTTKFDTYINAVDSITRHNVYGVQFDGVSIDWEFPTEGATGRANYTLFLTKLRAKLDTWTPNKGLIGMAVPTWYWWDTKHTDPVIDLSTLNTKVDLINLMEYGMENTSAISHYSPLYKNSAVSQETWDLRGINEWKGAGVDPSRIVTLLPFESIKMTDNSGITPVAIGHAGGSASWIGIRDVPAGVTVHYDSISMCNWAESGNSFYSYENATSLAAKVQYVRSKSIGGLGIWELWRGWLPNAAAGQHDPLLQELKAAVGGIIIPPDTIKPVVTLTSPANGDTVTGTVTVNATASDNVSVASVQLLVNGIVTATDNAAPYTFSWNASSLSGTQTLAVKATDGAGNSATTSPVTVFVVKAVPDTIKPVVALTSPANGDSLTGIVTVTATASDNKSVASVQLLVNGVVTATDNVSPYTFSWNTAGLTGAQILAVKATDGSGNSTTTSPITVQVKPSSAPALSWIYADTLEAPWRDTSWSSTNVYNSKEQVYAGLYSLKTSQTAWGAVSVHSGRTNSETNLDPKLYSQFQFAVYNTAANLVLNVYCYNDSGNVFPNVFQNNVPVNQWTIISIPMSQLDPNNYKITRVNIQNYTQLSPTYYIDNVHFVDSILQVPVIPSMGYPLPNAVDQSISPVISWATSPGATTYELQVSLDSTFASIVFDDSSIATTSKQVPALSNNVKYYWRVSAKNSAGESVFSQASSFVTAAGNSILTTNSTFSFSSIHLGVSVTDSTVIHNTGNFNLIISSIQSTNPVFTITPSTAIIAPSTSMVFSVTAHPTVQQQQTSGYLIFSDNSPNALDTVKVQISSVTSVVVPKNLPTKFSLEQNYPNPFNPSTTIAFGLPVASHVSLKIFDVLGREVKTIVNEFREPGVYKETFNANHLSSGLYFYQIRAGNFIQTGKMQLVK